MKPGEEDTKAHELVLIRRRAPVEEGGHHGGVWKIAYADFMTAMMAFFLVMWLINSTDQKVLTQVANYFNPMRLTDSTPHTRGVNTIESGEQGKEGKQSAVGDPKEKKDAKDKSKEKPKDKAAPAKSDAKEDKEAGKEGKARYAEQALFSDPYGVLARIAAEAETDGPPPVPASKDGSGAGGDVYLDPFDPAAQRTAPEKRSASPKAAPGREAKKAKPAPAEGEAKTPQETDTSPNVVQGLEAKKVAPAAGGDAKLPQENVVATRETSREASLAAEKAENAAAQELLKSAKQAAAQATAQKAATKDEAARIENEIKQVTSRLQGTIPNIDVTVTDDGVLISLTDDYDFGMFAIASAEPRPAMVVVMEKMAKILQGHPQPLVVRGHTDGRPYRSGTYDNWRLSTARAHMAYYMLVRGGIDEKRFERVEGYADRSLRVPDNPEAAQNRRIEILLRRSKQ